MNSPKVVVQGLCKVFGANPEQAIGMLADGATKEEVFARTGQIVGVHDVSFEVEEGEIFVLMGLSGSGKSTLIRLINRLVDPSAGKVLIDGRDVVSVPRSELTALRRKDMSMVFQSFALMPQRTVLSNAAFGLEVAGMGRKEREKRAMAVLDQVGLAPFAEKLPAQLSGGMQQRVGLARALAHKMLRTLYAILSTGSHYEDKTVDYEALSVARNAPRWMKMLLKHGFIKAQTTA